MDGADHEDRPEGERSAADTEGDGSTDETGGFVFGTDPEPVDNASDESEAEDLTGAESETESIGSEEDESATEILEHDSASEDVGSEEDESETESVGSDEDDSASEDVGADSGTSDGGDGSQPRDEPVTAIDGDQEAPAEPADDAVRRPDSGARADSVGSGSPTDADEEPSSDPSSESDASATEATTDAADGSAPAEPEPTQQPVAVAPTGAEDDQEIDDVVGEETRAEEGTSESPPPDDSPSAADDEQRITIALPDEATPAGEPPDREPTAAGDGPGPGENAVRNWTLLLGGLGSASFLTAIVASMSGASSDAALGAVGLGVGFLAILLLGRTSQPAIIDQLSSGWAEHRRSTYFATALFVGGVVIGALLLAAGVDLLEEIMQLFEEELVPDGNGEIELTATFFILNNTQPFLLTIAGALTLGLLTAFVMVVNGVIVGNLGAVMANVVGIDYVIVGLAPHGIFELAALFLAAGVGFRILYRFGERVFGSRAAFFTKPYLTRTVAIVAFAWLVLVLAAFVEAYVTPELLEMLFAERLAGLDQEPTMP